MFGKRKKLEKLEETKRWLRRILSNRVEIHGDEEEVFFVKEEIRNGATIREYAKLEPYASLIKDAVAAGKTSADELIEYCRNQVRRNTENKSMHQEWVEMLQRLKQDGLLK